MVVMEHYSGSLDTVHVLFLIFALALALAFEFVNGFHDTANAVATVIYTNSLRPPPSDATRIFPGFRSR